MKKGVLFSVMFLFMLASLATAQTEVTYYYGDTCAHCLIVADNGVIERVAEMENVSVIKYEMFSNPVNSQRFTNLADDLGLKSSERGVPFILINSSGKLSYLIGDKPIIANLENIVANSGAGTIPSDNPNILKITFWGVIVAAIVDSINPCAIGVLVFLMISLLGLGSSKRALRAGLLYTLVVFLTYFLAGLGIFSAIQSLGKLGLAIHFVVGLLALGIGLMQWNDIYRELKGKRSVIAISKKIKPFIEKTSKKGTIFAILILGVVVSLFELPCTGGIYVAILGLMAQNKTFSLAYLVLYNFIFVLPLIILTFLIYKGTSPKMLENWNQEEKKWMKFASGVVLIALGLYIIISLL